MNTKFYRKEDTLHLSDALYRAIILCMDSTRISRKDRLFIYKVFSQDTILVRKDLHRFVTIVRCLSLPSPLARVFEADVRDIFGMIHNRYGVLRLLFQTDVTAVTFYSTIRKGQSPPTDCLAVTYSCSGNILGVTDHVERGAVAAEEPFKIT